MLMENLKIYSKKEGFFKQKNPKKKPLFCYNFFFQEHFRHPSGDFPVLRDGFFNQICNKKQRKRTFYGVEPPKTGVTSIVKPACSLYGLQYGEDDCTDSYNVRQRNVASIRRVYRYLYGTVLDDSKTYYFIFLYYEYQGAVREPLQCTGSVRSTISCLGSCQYRGSFH